MQFISTFCNRKSLQIQRCGDNAERAVPELSELDESFLALALGVAVLTGAAGRHEINSFAPRKKKQQLYLMYKINDYMLV